MKLENGVLDIFEDDLNNQDDGVFFERSDWITWKSGDTNLERFILTSQGGINLIEAVPLEVSALFTGETSDWKDAILKIHLRLPNFYNAPANTFQIDNLTVSFAMNGLDGSYGNDGGWNLYKYGADNTVSHGTTRDNHLCETISIYSHFCIRGALFRLYKVGYSLTIGGLIKSANPSGNSIEISSPLEQERFVKNEQVKFHAAVLGDQPPDGSDLQWSSSIDGHLGSGTDIQLVKLTPGNHTITVTGYGLSANVPIRVFDDLGALYQAPLSQAEINRVQQEFMLNYVDGTGTDESWNRYDNYLFDQNSTDPSKIVILAKLDLFRHQQFSEPLPFADGKPVYEHLKAYVKTFNLGLDCGVNNSGGGTMNLNRNMSVWDSRASGSSADPDACKKPFTNHALAIYDSPLYLIMHECRHNEPGDPGHVTCTSWSDPGGQPFSGMDQQFENGSGYAMACLYLMWVYQYGTGDPPEIKQDAKTNAISQLRGRFCTKPTHSNPKVQAILDAFNL